MWYIAIIPYDRQLTEFRGPEPSECNESLFFTPSSEKVDLLEKLEEGQTVARFPEEEGMYIGHRPKVSQPNQNRLERRLLLVANPCV